MNADRINANIAIPGGNQTFGSVLNASSDVTFRVRRVGSTILGEFDDGSGFVTLHSRTDSALTAPVRFSLFLIQEFGSTSANSGQFDNWLVTADNIVAVPEPTTATLFFSGLALFAGVFRRKASSPTTSGTD